MHLKISIREPIFLDLGTKKFFFFYFFYEILFKKKNYTEEILFPKELNFPFPKCTVVFKNFAIKMKIQS
jgi:hypothetical protein